MFTLTMAAQTVAKKTPLTDQELKRWSHLDLEKDSIPGMSVDKVYSEFLKNKKSTKVIVAVIDSGVDIDHEDLKPLIWTNKKEIPNNGKDDDKNGFVDDVHGWNFLGKSNNENLEMTRILKKADDGSEVYKNALADYTEKFADVTDLKENLDVLQETIKDIWLEFTDEYPDFEIEPYFNLAGDYLNINIKFNDRVIRLNPGHSSKVKDEKLIKFIEELSEATKGLLENEFGSFNHKMTFKIDGRLTYTGDAGRFGTEIIPSLKKRQNGSLSDYIYNRQYKMLSVDKLGLSDDKLAIGVDDIQTLLDDIDKCYTTDEGYLIEIRPEENKSTSILISGISIIFRKVK